MEAQDGMNFDEFLRNHWKQQPYQFSETLIDAERDGLDLDWSQNLLKEMPDSELVYRSADGGNSARMVALPLDDSIRNSLCSTLENTTNSLMIHRADRYDPRLRRLVDEYVDSIACGLNLAPSSLRDRSASVFLSSPGAVSSFHTDREQNFLVHLLGKKTMRVIPRLRSIPGEVFEAVFRKRKGIHHEFQDKYESHASVFELAPGSTLYVPRLLPHWVHNGNQVSQSLSINFFCRTGFVIERFYNLNDKLRSIFGLA